MRVLAAAGALVVAAAFALAAVQAHELGRAEAIIAPAKDPTAAQARTADDALDVAGTLNPDTGVDLERAQLRIDTGRHAAAVRLARRVVRAEPENIAGWSLLRYAAGLAGDDALSARAAAEVRRLSPPTP